MEMKVWVKYQEVTVVEGATEKDAVLRSVILNGIDLSKISQVEVSDFWGHEIDIDAPLRYNMSINFKFKS